MKILVEGQYSSIQHGGDMRTMLLSKILKSLGHEVIISSNVPYLKDKIRIYDDISIYSFSPKENINYLSLSRLNRFSIIINSMKLRNNFYNTSNEMADIDLIYSITAHPFNLPSLIQHKKNGIILWADQYVDSIEKHFLTMQFAKYFFKKANMVTTPHLGYASFLNWRLKVPWKKLSYIPNVVDINRFNPDVITENPIEELVRGSPTILNIGRIASPDRLLKVFKLVKKNITNVKLLMVGLSPTQLIEFKQLSNNQNLSEDVLICPPCDNRDIPKYIKIATVCPIFYPSNFLNPPGKVYEYMAMKKPIITSNFPGIWGVLNHNNSIIIPFKNKIENLYASEIIKVIENPHLAVKLGNCAREKVIRNYTFESVKKNMSAALDSIK